MCLMLRRAILNKKSAYIPILLCSVAATGKGGGCVLASATAHVAEPQHTLSLYYPLFTDRSFYRRISPNFKRNLILLGGDFKII